MKKILATSIVIGVISTSFIFDHTLSMKASVIANEQPLAGITLTLDKYYETQVTENEKDKNKDLLKTDTTKEEAGKTEPIVLNMKYDRLGISKVDNYLNIREEPGEDGKIIGKLPKNAGCNVYSIEDGWAKIKSGKVSGYVSSEFLILDKEAEAYAQEVAKKVATVNADILNVRYLPSVDSRIYTLVSSEEDLEILHEEISEKFINDFIEKTYKDEKDVLAEVNQEEILVTLKDWVCVTIDNEKVFVAKDYIDVNYTLERAVFIEELAEDGSSGVSSLRAQMVQYAKQFLGNKYVYGGTSLTNGIDCSAFMMRIYQHFGYTGIPRNSAAQAEYTTTISADDAKPGDLFFYGNGSGVSHVAMYIGNGQVIHASNPTNGIKISNSGYRTPIKVGRIIND